jgi:hypothetical protein
MSDLPLKCSATPADSGCSRILAAIESPDLITVVIFSVIGFLVTLNLILRVPDFSAIS